MSSRLSVLGSFLLVVCSCQKDRGDIEPTSSAEGTAISAVASGSGGSGGGGGAGTGTGTGGDAAGGSAATSTTSSTGSGDGGSTVTTTAGGGGEFPSTYGAEGECWGDAPSPCETDICTDLFVDCERGVPSDFARACGGLAAVLRVDIWAHIVDCLRDAGAEVGCTSEGEATADACYALAFDEACSSPEVDDLCDATGASCAGFDVEECKRAAAILAPSSLGDYEACLAGGGECATLHEDCF